MSGPTYDEAATSIMLDRGRGAGAALLAIDDLSRAQLEALASQAAAHVGAASDPCAGCGCTTYEERDGDLLCGHCGLQHGADADE
jgi:hypothetical protein